MQQYRKNLGKVSLTAEGAWDLNNSYDILSIVYDEHTQHSFISRKVVPQGVDLYNKECWMPLNVSGYADNNVIILSKKTSEATIQSYTLEEAIASIKSVGRRPGAILGFYNENNDRLDIGGRWELWQFNDTNVYNWENVDSWQNLYYNYNKFMGWFKDENFLNKYAPFPEIGCYAFVGSEFNEATIYRCDNKYVWNNTTQHAWDYVKVIVDGNVTVGENGNWFNDGKDTGIPASVKGENGKTPVFREKDNTIQYSFDNVNWITISDKVAAWFRWNATTGDTQANNVGRIQISRDNVTWTNLSGDIINNLHISRYIGADETLPASGIAEGTIYAKGPTYADGDTSHANPIYRLWVYAWKDNTLAWQDNGEFTSIAAGIVQETGNSETEVMSQKAVTEKLSELGSYQENNRYIYAVIDNDGKFLLGIDKNGNISASINGEKLEYLINSLNKKVTNTETSLSEKFDIVNSDRYIYIISDVDGNVIESFSKDKRSSFLNEEKHGEISFRNKISLATEKAKESLFQSLQGVTSINSFNPKTEFLPKFRQVNKGFVQNVDGNRTPPLVLCHVSDTHGEADLFKRMDEFLSEYRSQYADVIVTGDIVDEQFGDSLSFIQGNAEKYLLVIGNHDAWRENKIPVEIMPQADVYNKFFKPFINNWSVVQPTNAAVNGDLCYYKDYKTNKIRLIVIDCMHNPISQIEFVKSALSEANSIGYSVVIASHYSVGNVLGEDVTFHTFDYRYKDFETSDSVLAVANLVDDFIDNGGKFICWLSGHQHLDYFGYVQNHPRQLNIGVENAYLGEYYSDSIRAADTKLQESFNIISFDTASNLITIFRVGNNTDRHLRKKEVITWDYVNRTKIANY